MPLESSEARSEHKPWAKDIGQPWLKASTQPVLMHWQRATGVVMSECNHNMKVNLKRLKTTNAEGSWVSRNQTTKSVSSDATTDVTNHK